MKKTSEERMIAKLSSMHYHLEANTRIEIFRLKRWEVQDGLIRWQTFGNNKETFHGYETLTELLKCPNLVALEDSYELAVGCGCSTPGLGCKGLNKRRKT